MFNLIYLVLGIYLIKIIVIRANIEYKKRKSTDRISLKKCIESKVKSIFADGNNIFVFRNNKNDYKEDSNINNKEEWNLKRHKALEKAKYKCEECGNITNLEVYTKEINNDEELIVLCKMCYEKNIGEIKLHYQ
ncbi:MULTISPECIES: hypothetical protein [Clostridia]|jgi:prolyl oligopeptidase PreP (S9A serine peptidase family)|uniref:hypothetical protein n=1 Tax=Clostridia TaxID=186801 RepID=UPI0011DD93CE|nr:hypothetical protein [Paraclostridium bifermentans]MBQ8998025.1 hypothetical protein [Clostridium sp.]